MNKAKKPPQKKFSWKCIMADEKLVTMGDLIPSEAGSQAIATFLNDKIIKKSIAILIDKGARPEDIVVVEITLGAGSIKIKKKDKYAAICEQIVCRRGAWDVRPK